MTTEQHVSEVISTIVWRGKKYRYAFLQNTEFPSWVTYVWPQGDVSTRIDIGCMEKHIGIGEYIGFMIFGYPIHNESYIVFSNVIS